MIIVIPSPQPRKRTAEAFRKYFGSPEAQELVMPGANHKAKAFIEDLRFPCVALDYDLELPQFAPAVVQVRNYIMLIQEKMVQVQFYGIAPPSDDVWSARKDMIDHVVRSIKVE